SSFPTRRSSDLNYIPNVLHTGIDRAQRVERPFQLAGDYKGKGGLSHSRRSPEDHRWDGPAFDPFPEHRVFTYQMLLTGKGFQTGWTHPFGERDMDLISHVQ